MIFHLCFCFVMSEKKVGKRSFGYLAFLLASLFEGDLQAGDAPCRLRREEGDGDRNAVEGVYKKTPSVTTSSCQLPLGGSLNGSVNTVGEGSPLPSPRLYRYKMQ